ncbi:MEDS domain-containing protein [Jidongwangia harbinensis]|uniref:MEDS domain-containing protein n=1 Tax=Jidongwangia harbinensis TaxID=2878561 RepID=UPI001CDA1F1F|nr:MEDS domain-containing protein [Jidongwangia harbinensis]MCA2212915.1 MEDS domain-containing protein [Jidongwangia harbinensis]
MQSTTPVDRLRPGDHACLTYSDPEERLDILAGFVATGLDRGERVICYTDAVDDLRGELVERGLAGTGHRLSVEPSERLWGDGAGPDAAVMVKRLRAALDEAERQNHTGLRFTADMCWAARPQANAEQLLAFESEVGRLFGAGRLTAICEYDRDSFDPVTLGYAARVHTRTVAATVYHEDAVLRICRQHVPPGIRAAGDLDRRRAAALEHALAEAVRLDPDIHLNLNHLRHLDAGAAAVILRTAAGLPGTRRMVVVCADAVERTLRAAGADDVSQLRLLVRHAER